jgi:hypothetical protein
MEPAEHASHGEYHDSQHADHVRIHENRSDQVFHRVPPSVHLRVRPIAIRHIRRTWQATCGKTLIWNSRPHRYARAIENEAANLRGLKHEERCRPGFPVPGQRV